MSIPVVADADVLFAATTRGLLIYLDYQGLIKLHWSLLILDEVSRALVDAGRKKTLADAKAHERRMREALPHALVHAKDVQAQFQTVARAVRSAKDTHVAACAYSLVAANAYPEAKAVALVTRNVKDFSKRTLATLGIALHKPDIFLEQLFEMKSRDFASAFHHFRSDLASGPEPDALLERLHKDGQVETARSLLAAHKAGVARL